MYSASSRWPKAIPIIIFLICVLPLALILFVLVLAALYSPGWWLLVLPIVWIMLRETAPNLERHCCHRCWR